ncbi:hypothetical protein BG452_16910 [Streptomyces sp. CBMA123]|nr:hypothetical protein [Streptomyces sp. CBMA123]
MSSMTMVTVLPAWEAPTRRHWLATMVTPSFGTFLTACCGPGGGGGNWAAATRAPTMADRLTFLDRAGQGLHEVAARDHVEDSAFEAQGDLLAR